MKKEIVHGPLGDYVDLVQDTEGKNETKFTPWKIDDAVDLPLAIIRDTPDGDGILELGERTLENVELAKQIVRDHNAAPDMLEALQNLYLHCAMIHTKWGDGCNQKEADAVIKAGRIAISKALGE